MEETERRSVQVLRECIDLQNRKGRDYQSDVSTVRQADYYRAGVDTIYDIMWAKMLRLRSVLDAAKSGQDKPNYESIDDTCRDLINYTSFMAAYIEGKIDGQVPTKNMFNKSFRLEAKEDHKKMSARGDDIYHYDEI